MATTTPTAVSNATEWQFQNSYIERLMDHAALTAAHPDDTLILAGPPRYVNQKADEIFGRMLPFGISV